MDRGPSATITASAPLTLEEFEVNWKERLSQLYLFAEHRGDYRRLGDTMRAALSAAQDGELALAGPPFALFYDDPGRVAVPDLRARVCLPVAAIPPVLPKGLAHDVLPQATVVYGRIAGAYPEAARTYPALFEYLKRHGWKPAGPIREVYLQNPADVSSYEELVTEVQLPWTRF